MFNTTYVFEDDGFTVLVLLERIKNTPSGNPRYHAYVINYFKGYDTAHTAEYTIKGHYLTDKEEATMIYNYYLDDYVNV